MRSFLWFSFFFILIVTTACKNQKATPSLEGNWIQAGQYLLTDQDTIWQRQAFIWELNADSSGQIYQFQLQQELTAHTQEIKWQLEAGKIKLQTSNAAEYWPIVKLSSDSLILEAPASSQVPQKIYWLFRRMRLPQQAQKNTSIAQQLQSQLQEVRTTTYLNDSPLQWEAIGHHFIHPNVPQSWYLPLRWGIIDFKGQTLIGLQAILSGQVNQWEILEVDQFDGQLLKGRYFKAGKAEQLSFASIPPKNPLQENQLIGSWQGSQNIKRLTLSEDQQYQLTTEVEDTKGSYFISKAVPLIYLQQGFRFQYLKIEKLSSDNLKAQFFSKQKTPSSVNLRKTSPIQ